MVLQPICNCKSRNKSTFIDDIVVSKAYHLQGTLSVDIIDDIINKSDHLAIACHVLCDNVDLLNEC